MEQMVLDFPGILSFMTMYMMAGGREPQDEEDRLRLMHTFVDVQDRVSTLVRTMDRSGDDTNNTGDVDPIEEMESDEDMAPPRAARQIVATYVEAFCVAANVQTPDQTCCICLEERRHENCVEPEGD